MQFMSEATTATFEQEVLQRSQKQVVVVDFWAEWCAPCRALGPLLEAAIEARDGAVWLVKIDTDQNQELAIQLGIRGIPAVKAFFGGQLIDEFVGAQDRSAIDAFLDRVSPSGEEQALEQAERRLRQGRPEQVAELLAPALASVRFHEQALVLLAQAQDQQGDLAAAQATLAEIPQESVVSKEATSLRTLLQLKLAGKEASLDELRQRAQAAPRDSAARWSLAGGLVLAGKEEEALETLLELLQRDRSYAEDGARRAMLALFELLGPESELTRQYRRQLQIYL